ncbi:MAG TPA: ribonuclease P protein component [Acidimicrobiales bacterium]|nr:ribonuclease P protein component [Acidimicrobiales bacterium]
MAGRIRDRATFEQLRLHGRRCRVGSVTAVYVREGADPSPRVAYAVGRRVGSAVVRNRLRRRLKAAVEGLELKPGSYLVAAGRQAGELGFEELRMTVASAMTSAARKARE